MNQKQFNVYVPEEMYTEIEAALKQLNETSGYHWKRNELMRKVIEHGLAAIKKKYKLKAEQR